MYADCSLLILWTISTSVHVPGVPITSTILAPSWDMLANRSIIRVKIWSSTSWSSVAAQQQPLWRLNAQTQSHCPHGSSPSHATANSEGQMGERYHRSLEKLAHPQDGNMYMYMYEVRGDPSITFQDQHQILRYLRTRWWLVSNKLNPIYITSVHFIHRAFESASQEINDKCIKIRYKWDLTGGICYFI